MSSSIYNLIERDLKLQKNNEENDNDSILEWVPDNITKNCTRCNILFTLLNRKHHCRYCGKIFCNECANYYINIPNEARTTELIKKNNILDIRYYINTSNNERVCHKCYIQLMEWKELNRMYSLFSLLPLDINDYLVIRLVCKNWYKIAQYHLTRIREIQIRYSDKSWTEYELNMIHINRYLLTGHSKWIVNYIISTNWFQNDIQFLDRLLLNEKVCECNIMMCIKGCNRVLSYIDLLLLIANNFKNVKIVKWIFSKLNNLDITTDELLSTLNIYINSLKYVTDVDEITEEYETFLLTKSKKTKKISNKLFWILTQLAGNEYFRNFRKKLIKNGTIKN